MLQEAMIKMLNEQINLEFYSANLYLQIAGWCGYKGLNGSKDFFTKHSQEEMEHMYKLFHYVNDAGSMPIISTINKPEEEFENLHAIIEMTLQHEQYITNKINTLVDFAITNKDYGTFNFLQWYVAEQHEEEKLFKDLLDMSSLTKANNIGIFMLDQEFRKLNS